MGGGGGGGGGGEVEGEEGRRGGWKVGALIRTMGTALALPQYFRSKILKYEAFKLVSTENAIKMLIWWRL